MSTWQGLEMWLEADANYTRYLELDIAELAERRVALAKEVHQHALSAGEHEHRIKTILKEAGTFKTELKRLTPKKKALVGLS